MLFFRFHVFISNSYLRENDKTYPVPKCFELLKNRRLK